MSFWIIFVICLLVGEISAAYVDLGPQEVTGNCHHWEIPQNSKDAKMKK